MRPAVRVDDFAVAVHDVVVLHDVPANVEVVALDFGLRALDRLGNDPVLDRHVVFHAEPVHDAADPLRAEAAHELVFERDVEARRARIALAAGATAKLVVDAAASWRSVPMMCRPPASATPGPSMMSVPRPAMLVAIVTTPGWPASGDDGRLALVLLGVEHSCAMPRCVEHDR